MKRQNIRLYDTTLRDGAQSVGVTFSLEDKLRITSVLDELGVAYIEGGWPGSNPKDRAFFNEAARLPLRQAKLAAFGSTRGKKTLASKDSNLKELIASGTSVATIFGKSWDLHVHHALKVSLEENLEMIRDTLRFLKKHFVEVIFDAEHFFDGYAANPAYALETVKAAEASGCDWIVLCDTNGGTLTPEIARAVRRVKREVRLPLGIHAHNDSELAVANSLAAVSAGATMVQGTINGLGERCGNANLCSLIPNLQWKQGRPCIPEKNMERLTSVSRLVGELCNLGHSPNLPYTGRHAFAHKGGIHVSAMRKDQRTYEHIPPGRVGNQRFISISELSGKSNVVERMRELGYAVDATSPLVATLVQKVKEMEAQGYHFEGADASFELLVQSLAGKLKPYFRLHGFRVITWKNGDGRSFSESTIKADVPEETSLEIGISERNEHTSADGSGPVEALDKALRKVFEKFYPQLKEVKLVDYKVRILNEDQGTRAMTRVLIHSADNTHRWATVGVSDNIIDASWQALVDAMIYKLMKDDRDAPKPAAEAACIAHDNKEIHHESKRIDF